jgi:HK97 family phage portal protein
MKLNFANRLKVLATGDIDEYRTKFLRGDDASDNPIDTNTAMKYSAVSACVRVLSETFASVPIILYKKTPDGREPVTDNDTYRILHSRPNSEMAPFGFNETLMANFCIAGNCVCEKQFNAGGQLVGIYPYPHTAVTIKRDDSGVLKYEIHGKYETRNLTRAQVLHIPNLGFDGVIGLSPISYAAQTIKLGLSYETYGVNFYKNGAAPSGTFEHPGTLTQPAYDRLYEDVKKNYTGLKNSGVPMILEEGMKWQQVTINPVDAQLIESKYFQIEDICRIYRVPQHLVNKLDRSTFNNIEHQSLEFVMYTMLPIYKRFEDNINSQLLTPAERDQGLYFEYKIDGLLRGDAQSRATAYATGRQWGWLSVNDIRRLENMSPISNGDRYLEPANMTEAGSGQAEAVNARLLDDISKMLDERR